MVPFVKTWHGSKGPARTGKVSHGKVSYGCNGQHRSGAERLGGVRRGSYGAGEVRLRGDCWCAEVMEGQQRRVRASR